MKKILCGVGAMIVALGALAAETLSFSGKTYDSSGNEKNPLEYALNETAVFKVSLIDTSSGNAVVSGRNLRWTLAGDDGSKRSGTATSAATPLEVSGTLAKAGFLRLTVEVQGSDGKWLSGNTEFFDGGAGFDVWNIEEWPRPSDFDSFWDNAKSTLLATPYTPTLTPYRPADGSDDIDYWVFSIPTIDGGTKLPQVGGQDRYAATGIIAMPKCRANGMLGIITHTFGYGYRGKTDTPAASEVFANGGNIVVHMTRWGENPVGDDAYYAELESCSPTRGFGNLDKTVQDLEQYWTHLRNLRALQYAKSRPEWNGRDIRVRGGSLGGYQGLCLAGLDGDVTDVNVSVPWSVDLGGTQLGRMSGWRPGWTENLDYVDAKNFAARITAPVTFSAGLGDYTCPPSGEVQLYRNLNVPVKATFTQNMGHGSLHAPSALCASYSLQKNIPAEPLHRTMRFIGGSGSWKVSSNWLDVNGKTNDLPRATDIIDLTTTASNNAKNDWADFEAYGLKLSAFNSYNAATLPIILDSDGVGVSDSGYIYAYMPLKLRGMTVKVSCSDLLGISDRFESADGNPFGIVKTGNSIAGLCPFSVHGDYASAYRGLKSIEIQQGTFAFNIQNKVTDDKLYVFPSDMVVTFSGANTKLALVGNFALTNFCVRETSAAVNAAHTIGPQNASDSASLKIVGEPALDTMTYSGAMSGNFSFTWAPDSDAKTFVFSGLNALQNMTGTVSVVNGAVRFAKSTRARKVVVSAGATLDVTDAALTANELEVTTGGHVVLSAGASLNALSLKVGGETIANGIYTGSAGTFGTKVDWIEGAGTVIVGATLNWVAQSGSSSYSNAGDPDLDRNWQSSDGSAAVPQSGDLIVLNNSLHKVALATSSSFLTRTANGLGGILFAGNGFAIGNSWSIIWGANDIYLAAGGYIRNGVVHSSQSARIWKNVLIKGDSEPLHLSSVAGGRLLLHRSVIGAAPILVEGEGTVQLVDYSHRGDAQAGLVVPHEVGANYYDGYHLAVPEIRMTSGTTDIRCWYKMTNTVVRFAGNNPNTTLEIGVSGSGIDLGNAIWFGNGSYLAEAEDVANGTHAITSSAEAYLQFQGQPGVAVQTFTGRLTGKAGLVWNPTSADCSFVFAQGTSDTTGSLLVSNGTVRVTDGATFTQLAKVATCPGATLQVDADSSVKTMTLAADGTVKLAAGATLEVKNAVRGGQALEIGTYTGTAGTAGTKVDWIEGAGVLKVGRAVYFCATTADSTLNGSANGGLLENWKEKDASGALVPATALPQSGDVIVFDNRNYSKGFAPTAAFNDATKAHGLAGMRFEGTGRVMNSSWSVVWGTALIHFSGEGSFMSSTLTAAAGPVVWANLQIVGTGPGLTFRTPAGTRFKQLRTVAGTAPLNVEGPGIVQFCDYTSNENNYKLAVPAINLRGGTADIRTRFELKNTAVRFDSDAEDLMLFVGDNDGFQDLTLGNGSSIEESAAVVNTTHMMSASAANAFLHVKGTPGKTEQIFTGSLSGTLGLDFNPSSSGYSFVFSKGTSDTTGTLIVSNGTVRLANGAKFNKLGKAVIGPLGVLDVDGTSSLAADEVAIGSEGTSTGRLSIGQGVTLRLKRVSVGGEDVPFGTYDASSAWVKGDGKVIVGGGPIWNRDDYPWEVTEETWYRGIDLYGANLTENDLTASAGGKVVLGEVGITCPDGSGRYSFGWPIALDGDQSWTIGASKMIDFHAPFESRIPGQVTVAGGSGKQIIAWAASTAEHDWWFGAGTTVIPRDGAGFGTGRITLDNSVIRPCGGTIPNEIAFTNMTDGATGIVAMDNTTESTFAGNVKLQYAGNMKIDGIKAPLRFAGVLSKPRGYIYFSGGGTYSFDAPVNFGVGAMSFDGATLNMNAATNVVGSNNFQFGSNGKLFTTVPYALCSKNATKVTMNVAGSGAAVWNLCGSDQSVTYLKGSPYSTVTSETAAVVHVNSTSNYATDSHAWSSTAFDAGVPTNYVAFAGGAGLQIDGNANGYVRLAGLSSTTGTLTVAGGGLVEMAASQFYPPDGKTYKGQWPNASAVSVTKGTLDIQHNKAFGKMTTLAVATSGATVKLSYTGSMRVGGLVLGGVEQPIGTYGSLTSDAQYKDARFTGTGILRVGKPGLTVLAL